MKTKASILIGIILQMVCVCALFFLLLNSHKDMISRYEFDAQNWKKANFQQKLNERVAKREAAWTNEGWKNPIVSNYCR